MSLLNRLGNAKNPYQTNTKKVLCVCSAGLLRSPTTAKVLAEEFGYNTRAAGIVEEYALIPVTEVLIYWADEIVFAEQEHLDTFVEEFSECEIAKTLLKENRFQVLNLPDRFSWNDETLVKYIKEKYSPSVE